MERDRQLPTAYDDRNVAPEAPDPVAGARQDRLPGVFVFVITAAMSLLVTGTASEALGI